MITRTEVMKVQASYVARHEDGTWKMFRWLYTDGGPWFSGGNEWDEQAEWVEDWFGPTPGPDADPNEVVRTMLDPQRGDYSQGIATRDPEVIEVDFIGQDLASPVTAYTPVLPDARTVSSEDFAIARDAFDAARVAFEASLPEVQV